MTVEEFVTLIKEYSVFLKPGGEILVICPQEKGFASDPTHVHFMDIDAISDAMHRANFTVTRRYSFPFPRWIGKYFTYNEFVVRATKNDQ